MALQRTTVHKQILCISVVLKLQFYGVKVGDSQEKNYLQRFLRDVIIKKKILKQQLRSTAIGKRQHGQIKTQTRRYLNLSAPGLLIRNLAETPCTQGSPDSQPGDLQSTSHIFSEFIFSCPSLLPEFFCQSLFTLLPMKMWNRVTSQDSTT